jgi:hypothetical protein
MEQRVSAVSNNLLAIGECGPRKYMAPHSPWVVILKAMTPTAFAGNRQTPTMRLPEQ